MFRAVPRNMSHASPVYENETLMVTRRTGQRQFLLKPSKTITQVILYVFAVQAQEMGISLHALVALSNHIHDVLTDPDGRVVDFYRDVHSNITKALNVHLGRKESIWSSSKTNRVALVTRNAIIDKIAYTLANPVEALLVRYGYQWPGIRMSWPMKPLTIKRPPFYFRGPLKGGKWPDEVTLTLERPPGFEDLSEAELEERIALRTKELEDAARAKADENGRQFLGRKNVLRTSRYACAKREEKPFRITPVVAARDAEARIQRIEENLAWRERYVKVRDRFIGGERDVVFPYGTYMLPQHFGANVETAT